MPRRRDAKNAPGVVDGPVAAVHRIEPVGDEQGSVWRHGHVRGAVVAVDRAAYDVDDASRVAGAGRLRGKGPHDVTTGLGVNHLPAKRLRQQVTLVHENAGGRARTGDEQVRHHSGIVLVPHATLHRGFHVGALAAVVGSRPFIAIAVVAVLHHEVHTAGARSVVVVRLPHGTEGIDGHLPVVAEVVAEHLHSAAIRLAPDDHALLIGPAAVVHGIPEDILHLRTIRAP